MLLFCAISMLLERDFSNTVGYRFFRAIQQNRHLFTCLISALYAIYHIQDKVSHWILNRIHDFLHCRVEKIIQDIVSQLFGGWRRWLLHLPALQKVKETY